MTLHRLTVEPRDVAAEALGLLLGAPAPPALAELRLGDGRGGTLVLGLLGASHVVTGALPGHRLTEQVSCDALAGGGQQLPLRHETAGGYALSSSTSVLDHLRLEALAGRLRARADAEPAWICGAFPGADSAVTALAGSGLPGGGWAWRTWHLYPRAHDGVVVATTSRWKP